MKLLIHEGYVRWANPVQYEGMLKNSWYLQTKLKGMRAGNSYNFYRKCDSLIFFLSETRFDYIVILT